MDIERNWCPGCCCKVLHGIFRFLTTLPSYSLIVLYIYFLAYAKAASLPDLATVSASSSYLDCPTSRAQALAAMETGQQDVFVPECTADGLYSNPQCYGFLGSCWCCDPHTGQALSQPQPGPAPAPHITDCSEYECQTPAGAHMTVTTSVSYNNTVTLGRVVEVECQSGFSFQDGETEGVMRCMGNNTWSPQSMGIGCTEQEEKSFMTQMIDFFASFFKFLFG